MSGQGQDDKNSNNILWVLAGIFIAALVIWGFLQDQLKFVFVYLRYAELQLLYWILEYIPFLDTQFAEIRTALGKAQFLIKGSNYLDISLASAKELSTIAGSFFRYPFILILCYFSYNIFSHNVKRKYKKKYDMKALAAQEYIEWPQIKAVLGQDLVKQDLNSGPWAMAQTPLQFCKKNKLISIEVILPSGENLLSDPKFKMHLNKERAERVFAAQLGRMWRSPEAMPEYVRALFALFVGRGARDSQAAKDLVFKINSSIDPKKPGQLDFTGVDELWKKHYKKREIQNIINAHAYESTVMTALFLYAREDGVFPTADFLWLKPVDRKLWYVLNNVGRQTPHSEAAGVHAHFLAEKALKRALSMPMIEEAVKGLQLALDDVIYVPTAEEKEELIRQAMENMK